MPTLSLSSPKSIVDHTHRFPMVSSFHLPHVDPFELYSRITEPGIPSFLLESGKGVSDTARYSFFGSDPYLIVSGRGSRFEIRYPGQVIETVGDPFSVLLSLIQFPDLKRDPALPPFVGGAIGFFSYDLARHFESIPECAEDDLQLPDLEFIFIELLAAIDHQSDTLHLIFTPAPDRLKSESHDQLLEEGRDRLEAFKTKLFHSVSKDEMPASPNVLDGIQANQSRADYTARVRTCQDYIAAGDIYQANLSHRFDLDWAFQEFEEGLHHSSALYQRLRHVNPAPFSALLQFHNFALVSCSPERLVQLQGIRANTRPIAGTRPRGQTLADDRQLVENLLRNDKERAEHLMLLDLARNDLGRVCRYGTVQVDEFMIVERYSHVSHLVSSVSGHLHPQSNGAHLIRAVFPGGTITGVPKIRCMEIIEELEPVRRGPYTGSIGYWSWTGNLDFNIVIRTILLTKQKGYLQVGAGIVADSDPDREYEETLHKAQALFQALRVQNA